MLQNVIVRPTFLVFTRLFSVLPKQSGGLQRSAPCATPAGHRGAAGLGRPHLEGGRHPRQLRPQCPRCRCCPGASWVGLLPSKKHLSWEIVTAKTGASFCTKKNRNENVITPFRFIGSTVYSGGASMSQKDRKLKMQWHVLRIGFNRWK